MSALLRRGTEWLRLDLLERLERPPVVAPPAAVVRARMRAAAGIDGRPPSSGEGRAGADTLDAALDTALDAAPAASRIAPDFRERASRARAVCLAVPDATRRGAWEPWVAPALAWLERATPAAASRVVLVASGVHRPALPEGVAGAAAAASAWRVLANGADGFASHVAVGATSAGTEVRLHPLWVASDLRVALADISFHYFAGFGGGRKLVFPGLAEPSGILANHRRSLTAEGWPDPACEPGRLAGNPVHEDLVAAAALCPPHLLIQAYEPRPGADPVLEVGEPFASHEQACARYAAGHRIEHTQRPELLVADAGGTPRDATFLQAHKSLQHAARYLPDGGSLLLVAALEQGSGSESFQRLWSLEPGELARKAVESYELHTHTALALRCVTRRLEVAVLASPASPIVPEALSRAGIRAMVDPGEALRWIEERGRGRAWGWLARAEETLPERIGAEGGKRQPGLRQAEAAGEERR